MADAGQQYDQIDGASVQQQQQELVNYNYDYSFPQPPDDLMQIFNEYKRTWQLRLKACGSDTDLRITSLETMVDELLEHNGLLASTIVELQKEASARAMQMDRRLTTSAKCTEEAVVGLDRFTKELQRVIGHHSAQIHAVDIIEELTNHLDALKVENAYLRDKNENLKHDMGNLLELVKLERNRSQLLSKSAADSVSSFSSSKCLTFCDTVNPEDVFGEIVSCVDDTPPPSEKSSPQSADHTKITEPPINKPTTATDTHTASRSSLTSSGHQYQTIIEEKELLINELQTHLASATNQIDLKDQVINNIEAKLSANRQKIEELTNELAAAKKETTDCTARTKELTDCIESLNEDKRKLMTQLDEQSEDAIKAKAEVLELTAKLIDIKQQMEYQATTIEHLKDAIVSKMKANPLNSGFGSFLARPLSPTSQTPNANGDASRKNCGLDNV